METKTTPEVYAAVAYSDIFDSPLKISEANLKSVLIESKPHFQVSEKDGYLFFQGREEIVERYKQREKISEEKLLRAKKFARFFSFIPWVKMVAVTGSVAASNAKEEDDIDLLIISSSNRVWLTRLLSSLVLDFLKVRRKRYDSCEKDKLCLNMYLSEDKLEFEKKDIYTAFEITLLKPIYSKEQTFEKLLNDNRWLISYLPNFRLPDYLEKESSGFRVKFLDYLESWVRKLQRGKMGTVTKEVLEEKKIFFHPQDVRNWVLREFQKRVQVN